MQDKPYFSTQEAAKILGVSRITVFNRIKKGQLKAIKAGRNYVIAKETLSPGNNAPLTEKAKKVISQAVEKTVREYGETLKLLAND